MVSLDDKAVELRVETGLELRKESSDPSVKGTVIYEPQFRIPSPCGHEVDHLGAFDTELLSHVDTTMESYSMVCIEGKIPSVLSDSGNLRRTRINSSQRLDV